MIIKNAKVTYIDNFWSSFPFQIFDNQSIEHANFQLKNGNFHTKIWVSNEYILDQNSNGVTNTDCYNIQCNQFLKQIFINAHTKTNDHLLGYSDLKIKLENKFNEIARLRCNQLNLARDHLRLSNRNNDLKRIINLIASDKIPRLNTMIKICLKQKLGNFI